MPFDENHNRIIPFDFDDNLVRTTIIDGEPWFVAADVCRVLGHSNPTMAISNLDDDERMTLSITDDEWADLSISEGQRGGARFLNIVSEPGLYMLIFTSRKPAAKRFRKWVTSEVLPALRKHGHYQMPERDPAPRPGAAEMVQREWEGWLSAVREARLVHGTTAARRIWAQSPLPPLGGEPPAQEAENIDDSSQIVSFIRARYQLTGNPADRVRASDMASDLMDWQREQHLPIWPQGRCTRRLAEFLGRWTDPETGYRVFRHKASVMAYTGLVPRDGAL